MERKRREGEGKVKHKKEKKNTNLQIHRTEDCIKKEINIQKIKNIAVYMSADIPETV